MEQGEGAVRRHAGGPRLEGGIRANIFNLRYRMLLSYLTYTYQDPANATEADIDTRRGLIVNRMFGEMCNLRAVAAVLVHLPLEHGSSQCCGPTFQMPYTLQLPETDAGYWVLHLDLIAATAALLAEARAIGNPERAEYARTVESLDAGTRKEMKLDAAADNVRTEAHRLKGVVRSFLKSGSFHRLRGYTTWFRDAARSLSTA